MHQRSNRVCRSTCLPAPESATKKPAFFQTVSPTNANREKDMKKIMMGSALAVSMLFAVPVIAAPSAAIVAAVADAGRPDADKSADAERKPAEMLDFAGVKAGDKVAELAPGGGYFTRV